MPLMMLRNSERQAFKTCRHRWQWTYRDGRQAANAPNALRFGDLIHQALAAYYKPGRRRGPAPAWTFERLYHEQAKELGDRGFDVYSDEKWEPALGLGIGMLEGYVKRYTEEDKDWEVISSEQTFQLPISLTRFNDLNLKRFKIVGTFDGVWRHRKTGRVIFKEFKTAAAITEDGLALDEQAGLYWTYGPRFLRDQGLLKKGELPSHILYTFLRKAIPDPDKARDAHGRVLNKPTKDALRYECQKLGLPIVGLKVDDLTAVLEAAGVEVSLLGEPSANQPAPYFARIPVYRDEPDRTRMHNRVCEEALDIAKARRGDLFMYKNPGPLHMPNCRGCPVRDACEVHEAGGDFENVLNASMINWDPYAAHELPERR